MRKKLLKTYLNYFWLRPENAILQVLRGEAYQSTLDLFGDGKGTIDIACGDGTFSFITLGGEFTEKTDTFQAINLDKKFRSGNYDTFDHFDKSYAIDIKKYPEKNYEFGTDLKRNLLSKTEALKWYSNLIEHDNNNPMPFENGTMNYIYSNSTHWVYDFDKHIKDLVRITSSGGHIVIEIKTDAVKKFSSKESMPFMGERFHEIIDAGRLSTWKDLRSRDGILKAFENINDVEITTFKPIYGDVVSLMWDIGLRPIFSPLVKMANYLPDDERLKIKLEWCSIFEELLSDFVTNYEPDYDTAMEFLVVLKKK